MTHTTQNIADTIAQQIAYLRAALCDAEMAGRQDTGDILRQLNALEFTFASLKNG
jgi:hypothetical protein